MCNSGVAQQRLTRRSMRVRSTLIVCLGFAAVAASAAPSFAEQSIALVLDASGSMVSRLPEGRTRIEAAKAAVGEIVGKLPPDVRLSLRAELWPEVGDGVTG